MSALFDTHAHLLDRAFTKDFDTVWQRTLEQTGAFLEVGCSFSSAEKALELALKSPQVFAAVGLHPASARAYTPEGWTRIRSLAEHPRVRAIGETGLDYHWKTATPEEQKELFRLHIELAKKLGKPLIIHDREAHRDCLDTLWAYGAQEVGGVFHAYSGSVEMMEEVLELNFNIGIGGVVTFKNAKAIKKVAAAVPEDRFVIETDCPYMTPTPFRGKRNEPAYTRYVAEAIGALRGASYDEVVTSSWNNACTLYQLDPATLLPLE